MTPNIVDASAFDDNRIVGTHSHFRPASHWKKRFLAVTRLLFLYI
ncbi:hypothetical protein [Thermostilla marina]